MSQAHHFRARLDLVLAGKLSNYEIAIEEKPQSVRVRAMEGQVNAAASTNAPPSRGWSSEGTLLIGISSAALMAGMSAVMP
jgi:hypothetical protein